MLTINGEVRDQIKVKPSLKGYRCIWPIVRTDNPRSSAELMAFWKQNPSEIFPFRITSQSARTSIAVGERYHVYPLRVRGEPVEVIDEDLTSFTFLSLPGHIHGSGATLIFRLHEARDGLVVLEQDITFQRRNLLTPAAMAYGTLLWRLQAQRLASVSLP